MSLQFQETLVAGGSPQDFPTLRHLVLHGSNYEIGKRLAEIVMERYGQRTRPSGDSRIIQARRLYFQQHYPITQERNLEVSFSLRDEPGADETAPSMAIRSDYHRFQLNAL